MGMLMKELQGLKEFYLMITKISVLSNYLGGI